MNNNSKPIIELTKTELKQIYDLIYGLEVCSFNRMSMFLAGASNFNRKQFSFGFREAYCGSDNLYPLKPLIKQTLLSNRIDSKHLMYRQERQVLEKLPRQIKIFRGMTVTEFMSGNYGFSWTLDYEVAKFFAKDYGRNLVAYGVNRVVVSKTICKTQALAYINCRNEKEVWYFDCKNLIQPKPQILDLIKPLAKKLR